MSFYKIDNNTLVPLGKTSFQKEDMKEQQLQTLFRDKITAINPDIMILSEEFHDWGDSGRRIDFLAVDKDANLVVIELKRTEDGGHMELQAIRYAAMVSNMTWEQAKNAFSKYIEKNSMDIDAEHELCEFFSWDSPRENDFAQNVRIILASANFSKEITTSVLWLNERDLDISCVRLSLYKLDDQLILNAEQIIPLPEAESYQIAVKQKRQKERDSINKQRDHSLFSIKYSGDLYMSPFIKADIGYVTVMLLQEKDLIDEEVFKFLKEDRSCGFKLLKDSEEITEGEKQYTRYRHTGDPELVYPGSGEGYYVARSWNRDNIDGFIDKIQNEFPEIKITKDEEQEK